MLSWGKLRGSTRPRSGSPLTNMPAITGEMVLGGSRSARGRTGGSGGTTIGCVGLLALIAGTVSYLYMHMLVARYGQPGWAAALTPLSVGGMIVAASTTLLADSRSGRAGKVLPWALLVAGSVASLSAQMSLLLSPP
jgi:hypothetical protein